MAFSITDLNQMSQSDFVATVGAVFEDTPAIAAQAWEKRPFRDVDELHQTMVAIVAQMSLDEKLTLIRAHPDLGSKAKMAEASVKEQAGAGLDRLNQSEYARFQQLNQDYTNQFGFPFIIAVKNHTKASILAAFEERLTHSTDAEVNQALTEIAQIAKFRLLDLIQRECDQSPYQSP